MVNLKDIQNEIKSYSTRDNGSAYIWFESLAVFR